MNAIESGYRIENEYHNSIHAADVLHATYYFIKKALRKDCGIPILFFFFLFLFLFSHFFPRLQFLVLSSLEVMAALIAAMIHDYAHPGVNNNFLIKIEHPLALRYNDRFASFLAFFLVFSFLFFFCLLLKNLLYLSTP